MFTCPCCGHATFAEPPGSYDICPICFWEDDATQLYYPDSSGGANPTSLIEAQVNFIQFGACDRAMASKTRVARPDEIHDSQWFPLWQRRVSLPDMEADQPLRSAMSLQQLYYWLRQP